MRAEVLALGVPPTPVELGDAAGRRMVEGSLALAAGRWSGPRRPLAAILIFGAVLAAFTTDPPCRRKANRPPGDAARAEAAKLLSNFEDDEVVVSLAAYQSIVDDMATRHGEVQA